MTSTTCNHSLRTIPPSELFDEYYYCTQCHKIFANRLYEVTEDTLSYLADPIARVKEMKRHAAIEEARTKVKPEVLEFLGLIEKE